MMDLLMPVMIFMFGALSEKRFLAWLFCPCFNRSVKPRYRCFTFGASLTPSTFNNQIFMTKEKLYLKFGTSRCLLNTWQHPFGHFLVQQNVFLLHWQANRWIFLRYQAIISNTTFTISRIERSKLKMVWLFLSSFKTRWFISKLMITTIYLIGRISLLASGIFDDSKRHLKEN